MSLRHAAAALILALTVAACGGPVPGALVGAGEVQLAEPGGAWEPVAAGPVRFADGDTLKVGSEPVRVVIACVPPLGSSITLDDRPTRGHATLDLAPGTQLRRRAGATLNLVSGAVELESGPLDSRLVVFHGTAFVEVHPGHADNVKGVTLKATADGDSLTVVVVRGAANLLIPFEKPMDLREVKLSAGETGTAKPGELPSKHRWDE